MDFKVRLLAGLGQSFDKILAVHIRFKNIALAVGAAHHMVDRPGYSILTLRGMNRHCQI